MAFSVNKVTILGNVTREPELRFTPKGTPVCSLDLATNRSIKDETVSTGWRDIPTYHRIRVWGKTGERVAKIPKGAKVYVEGRLENRTYEKDGQKHYVTEIVAEDVIDCSPRTKAQVEPTTPAPETPAAQESVEEPGATPENPVAVNPEDIPF